MTTLHERPLTSEAIDDAKTARVLALEVAIQAQKRAKERQDAAVRGYQLALAEQDAAAKALELADADHAQAVANLVLLLTEGVA